MDFGKTEPYYKTMLELQDKLRKSEEERFKLEEKFNEMMRHTRDADYERLRSLRHKYHKFLDDDKLRQDRNDAILRALDRVASRSQMLAAKTDRFKAFRQQYTTYHHTHQHEPPAPKPTQNPQDRSYILSNTRRKLFADHSESADAKLAMLEQYLRDNFDNFPPNKTKASVLEQTRHINQFVAPETVLNCVEGDSVDESKSDADSASIPARARSSVLGTAIEKELERLHDNTPIGKQDSVEEYVQDYKELVAKSEEKFGLKNSQFSPKRTVQKSDQLMFDPSAKIIDALKDNIATPTKATKSAIEVSKPETCVDDTVNDNPIIKKYKEVVKTLSEDLDEIPLQITLESVPKPIEAPKQIDDGRNVIENLDIAKLEEDNSDRTEPPLDISLSSPIQQVHADSPENQPLVEQILEKSTPEEPEKVLVTQQLPLKEQPLTESITQELLTPKIEATEKHLPETVQPQNPIYDENYPEYPANQPQYQDYGQELNQEQYNYPAQSYINPEQEQQNYPIEGTPAGFDPNYVPNETYPPTNSDEFDPNYVTENVYPSEANPGFKTDYPVQDTKGYSDEYQPQISANYPDNPNYQTQAPSGEIYAENQNVMQEPLQEDNQKYEQAENYPQEQQEYETAYNPQEYVENDVRGYDGQEYPPDQSQYPEGYQEQQYTQEQFAEGAQEQYNQEQFSEAPQEQYNQEQFGEAPQEQYNQEQYPQEYVDDQQYASNPEQTGYDPNAYRTEQEYLEGEQNLDLQQGEYPVQEYQSEIPNQNPPADYPTQEYQSEPIDDGIPSGMQLQSDQPEQDDKTAPGNVLIAEEIVGNDVISENSDKLISSVSESEKTGPIVEKTMPNLAEMLETDSESTKPETTKVSNDSDFEFSSNAQ